MVEIVCILEYKLFRNARAFLLMMPFQLSSTWAKPNMKQVARLVWLNYGANGKRTKLFRRKAEVKFKTKLLQDEE